MKKLYAFLLTTLLFGGLALAAELQQYQAGPRLIDGTQLNLMVDQVNNLTGNGTPGAVTGTTGTFSSIVSAGQFNGPVIGLSKITTNNNPPVLSSCGGTPTVVGSNAAGRLVTGSAATTCTITFANAYTGAPFCVISAEVATQPTYTVSASAITFATSIASAAYHYHCIARSGG